MLRRLSLLILLVGTGVATAQVRQIQPQILSREESDRKVTAVEVAPRFVTTIRLPETVSSVVVGGQHTSEIFIENGRFHGKQIIASMR